jgi:hypothetical protein
MGKPGSTLAGALARGALAGAVGTLAMDLVWYRRYRAEGGTDSFFDWEFSLTTTSWDDVSAPGQVGRLLVKAVADVDLPPSSAGLTSTIVHWATGTHWGALLGLAVGRRGSGGAMGRPVLTAVPQGIGLGLAAVGTSYTVLPMLGLYKPAWEYDARTLGRDLSAHLVYGVVTSLTYRALSRR